MTDRELLELAAKAAGIELNWFYEPIDEAESDSGWFASIAKTRRVWNPLTDDGDAFRLAVKLRMALSLDSPVAGPVGFCRAYPSSSNLLAMDEWANNDPYAATRRAIVRAAAEIGKQMEKS